MKKKCSNCKIEKCVEEFNRNYQKKDGLQTLCKECSRTQGKNHYQSNKAYYFRKNVKQRKKCKAYYESMKSYPCTDCKKTYPTYVMDWDHIQNKKYNVSRLVAFGSMKVLKNEISKCELVCSNCHRIRTHNRNCQILINIGA
jgi:hypothetical protein